MEIDGSETPWTHLILLNYVLNHVICIFPWVFLIGGKSKWRKYSLAGETTKFAGILKLFQLSKKKKKTTVWCVQRNTSRTQSVRMLLGMYQKSAESLGAGPRWWAWRRVQLLCFSRERACLAVSSHFWLGWAWLFDSCQADTRELWENPSTCVWAPSRAASGSPALR